MAVRVPEKIELCDEIHKERRFKKKSNNNIHALNQKIYKLDGKTVAVNRHKAMNQKEPSFEEFLAMYREVHPKKETQQMIHRLVIEPAKRTYTFHKQGLVAPFHCGDIVRYEKFNKVKGNTKRDTFVALSVRFSAGGHIGYGEKRGCRKFKYCHPIAPGCLQIVKTELTAEYLKSIKL